MREQILLAIFPCEYLDGLTIPVTESLIEGQRCLGWYFLRRVTLGLFEDDSEDRRDGSEEDRFEGAADAVNVLLLASDALSLGTKLLTIGDGDALLPFSFSLNKEDSDNEPSLSTDGWRLFLNSPRELSESRRNTSKFRPSHT